MYARGMTNQQTTDATKDIEQKEATVLELAARIEPGPLFTLRYGEVADRPGILALFVEAAGVAHYSIGTDVGHLPEEHRAGYIAKRLVLYPMITALVCKAADRARALHKLTTGQEAPALA